MNGENYGNNRKRKYVWGALIIVLLTTCGILLLTWCGNGSLSEEEKKQRESAIVATIQHHSRLFTAETTSRKTITYTSENKLTISLLGKDRVMKIPFGKTTATIPVNVTYKAYIDLGKVTRDDIIIDEKNKMIHITLPDPVVVETAVRVDHDKEKMDKEWFGKKLTYEEYRKLVRDAKEQAWEELTEEEMRVITETAKVTAGEMVTPFLHSLGFKNIMIEYRPTFTTKEIMKENY